MSKVCDTCTVPAGTGYCESLFWKMVMGVPCSWPIAATVRSRCGYRKLHEHFCYVVVVQIQRPWQTLYGTFGTVSVRNMQSVALGVNAILSH